MNITQSDRDTLRASQHKLNSNLIGNLIEHRVQDPKKYKQPPKSNGMKQTEDKQLQLLKSTDEVLDVQYESKYLNNDKNNCLSSIKEDLEKELPCDVKDLQSNSWLNMNQLEFDKLEWMSSKAEKMHQEKLETTTQFDKDGRAVSITASRAKNCDKSRGDETHDIETLFKLLDSAYHPQVTYSLNVIRGIASLASTGYYDGAFDGNIHQILLKGCLLRVRHHMDSPNETICLSALKCLRSLLCNTQVDEVIMDRFYPLISENADSNLWLHTIEMDSQEFNIEMKDSECVEVDTILGLVCRTDILKRFSYLLENKSGTSSFAYYESILDVLIRMARHSPSACYILSRKDLIRLIIQKFLPLNILSTLSKQVIQLAIKALKLMRIIAQGAYDLESANQKESNKPKIDARIFSRLIPSLEVYFNLECNGFSPEDSDLLFKLQIETYRIMKALCKLEFTRVMVISVIALAHEKLFRDSRIITNLDSKKSPDSRISIDWQYTAHLIDLIGSIIYIERYKHLNSETYMEMYWRSFIKPVLFQWITDLIQLKCIPHLDVSIAIAATVYHYNTRTYEKEIKELHNIMIEPIIKEEISTKGVGLNLFMLLARTASERSQLQNFTKEFGRLRDPKGLPSYGCLNYNLSPQYNFKLSPLFENDSPFILLNTYIQQLPKDKEEGQRRMRIFIDNINMNRYIRSVTGYHKYPTDYESMVQQSLIAQYEVQLISHSLLTLGSYYLDYGKSLDQFGKESEDEPEALTRSRIECYSNLCYFTISAIGLISMHAEYLVELKDKLYEKVLLNCKLQTRLTRENSTVKPQSKDLALLSLDHITCTDMFKQLSANYLNILLPVYMSFDQPDRFWIFQPILEYYFDHIKEITNTDKPETKKKKEVRSNKKDYWFNRNVPWRVVTGELATADDSTILGSILTFNSVMMLYSPSYLHLIIKPDIEDYLCLIGTLFLDDELFLHDKVNSALTINIRNILRECIEKSDKTPNLFGDSSKIIKPLELPLADFFNKLVDQFEAVSYGDIAFSNFLLLFLTPESDISFRKKLFQEKSETCLSQLRIAPEEVWAPKELFLSVKEKDLEMKELIKRSGAFISKNSFLNYYRIFHMSA